MKKILNISILVAFIIAMSTVAFAMDMNMDHSNHGKGGMKGSMHDGVTMMEKGIAQMKHGAKLMNDPATMNDGMGMMNKEMMPMHNGMKMIETGAEGDPHQSMIKNSMGNANKGMMEMMKGMGMMKKGTDGGMQMMNDGLQKMEKSLEEVKAMSGM
ncbi:hypothetical protein SAMN05660337_3196 [Maridesulfovibrio ferrireducens]|uniref:Pentapeptide MXKDX repeat protein n=1 Tax=Maridesulfovibrio ferrireducens TaxID=246191 RepID=A0A1G9KS93_9BACT|nr:hypothetical protein [Maridesulfovibrio ferrireducens]SDL52571.1 hypothetical protein SAMN05660337_3196 [Maridesulfovibrio ferrireducens]